MFGGIGSIIYGSLMNISAKAAAVPSLGIDSSVVVNLDLLSQRELFVVCGGIAVLTGVILFFVCPLLEAILKRLGGSVADAVKR